MAPYAVGYSLTKDWKDMLACCDAKIHSSVASPGASFRMLVILGRVGRNAQILISRLYLRRSDTSFDRLLDTWKRSRCTTLDVLGDLIEMLFIQPYWPSI